jgi:hypothetical protein
MPHVVCMRVLGNVTAIRLGRNGRKEWKEEDRITQAYRTVLYCTATCCHCRHSNVMWMWYVVCGLRRM